MAEQTGDLNSVNVNDNSMMYYIIGTVVFILILISILYYYKVFPFASPPQSSGPQSSEKNPN